MKKTLRIFSLFLFTMLCLAISSIAEEITLTTYYPAPFGNYEELQATKFAVGSGTSMPTADGNLEAAGTIRANTAFNLNGNDGVTQTYTVITDIRIVGINLQKQSRTITVEGGIITAISNTSWDDVGPIN